MLSKHVDGGHEVRLLYFLHTFVMVVVMLGWFSTYRRSRIKDFDMSKLDLVCRENKFRVSFVC